MFLFRALLHAQFYALLSLRGICAAEAVLGSNATPSPSRFFLFFPLCLHCMLVMVDQDKKHIE